MAALAGGQLSLSEAAAITEFEEDHDAITRLLEVAGSNRFAHRVAEIRSEPQSQKAYAEAAAHYAGQGYTVLDDYPSYGDSGCVELRYLRTATAIPSPKRRSPTRRTGRSAYLRR